MTAKTTIRALPGVFNVDGKPSVFRTASGLVGSTLDLGAVVYDVSGLRF